MKNYDDKKVIFGAVRQTFLKSQAPGRFPNGSVVFDEIRDDPSKVDAERHLAYMGIELNDEGRARCYCGSINARWDKERRRFWCPKSRGGCGHHSLDLVRLTEFWVRRGSPKPFLTDLPSLSSDLSSLPEESEGLTYLSPSGLSISMGGHY